MPKLGMEMTEGVLSRWLVQDREMVVKDQPIYEIETEKIETEICSPVGGALRQIATSGETYAVGALLAELE